MNIKNPFCNKRIVNVKIVYFSYMYKKSKHKCYIILISEDGIEITRETYMNIKNPFCITAFSDSTRLIIQISKVN